MRDYVKTRSSISLDASTTLNKSKVYNEDINIILSHEDKDYTILKLIEEFAEAQEVLIKLLTKPKGKEERMSHLIEELGDVKWRLKLAASSLNITKEVKERAETKAKFIADWYIEHK